MSMKPKFALSLVPWLAIASGCGGSNSSSVAFPPTPPPVGGGGGGYPPVPIGDGFGTGVSPPMLGAVCGAGQGAAANGGLWITEPQDDSTNRMRVLVAETGEFRWLPSDAWTQHIFGTLQSDGVGLTSTDAIWVVATGLTWLETEYFPIDIFGTFDELGGVVLEFDYPAAAGEVFHLSYPFATCENVYERDSSLETLAGTFISSNSILAIDEQGEIFYQAGSCVGNGTAELIDPDFNMYRMAIEIGSCTGDTVHAPGRLFEGLAYLSDSSDISTNDVLEFALSSTNATSTLVWSQMMEE